MLQVLIGLFTSNRDGEDALQALQMLGLSPGNGHLYQGGFKSEAQQGLPGAHPRICTQKSARSTPPMVSTSTSPARQIDTAQKRTVPRPASAGAAWRAVARPSARFWLLKTYAVCDPPRPAQCCSTTARSR
jgi:hypothetical protein